MIRKTLMFGLLALAACGNPTPRDISGEPLPQVAVDPVLSSKQAKQLFGAKRDASGQSSAPYGSYSKGCLAGGARHRQHLALQEFLVRRVHCGSVG